MMMSRESQPRLHQRFTACVYALVIGWLQAACKDKHFVRLTLKKAASLRLVFRPLAYSSAFMSSATMHQLSLGKRSQCALWRLKAHPNGELCNLEAT